MYLVLVGFHLTSCSHHFNWGDNCQASAGHPRPGTGPVDLRILESLDGLHTYAALFKRNELMTTSLMDVLLL